MVKSTAEMSGKVAMIGLSRVEEREASDAEIWRPFEGKIVKVG
jgi:hypothetical protein